MPEISRPGMLHGNKRGSRQIHLLAALGMVVALTSGRPAASAEHSSPASGRATAVQASLAPIVPDQCTPLEIGRVRLSGLLGKHVDFLPNRLLKGQREAYAAVFENPGDTNSWRAEHIGKWLETACNAMAYSHDARLGRAVNGVVDRLIQLQQPDGWLGSYAPGYRFHKYDWKGNQGKKYEPFWDGPFYDVWCHYLTMGGLIRCYETTGNLQALDAAKKIADLLIATFGPGRQDLMLINHDHGFGPGVGVLPVSKLYLLTGDPRYRDFAKYITTQYGRTGKVPITMTGIQDDRYPFPDWAQIKHCEFELCLAGMCQLYRGTGEPQFFATARNIYEGYFAPLNDTMSLHGFKTPPPGMRVPDTYYGFLETCDIVPMLRWYVEMARITGDSKYLDAVEWNLYNSLLSRDLPDGRVWPGVDEPKSDFFHCCYSMLAVGISYVPNWAYFTTSNGIIVNLYESSTASIRVAGQSVKIRQTTEYPLDGTVKLSVEPEKTAVFDLLLRIPKWCRGASVSVNGSAVEGVVPGEFLRISREWKRSNRVTLSFDMGTRAVRRSFEKNGGVPEVTLERGPLLLALTTKLNPGIELESVSPTVGSGGFVECRAMSKPKAVKSNTMRFMVGATMGGAGIGNDPAGQASIIMTPYAFSGVSDKPVPKPREGVFNVYSEDGVGKSVKVEFPLSRTGNAIR